MMKIARSLMLGVAAAGLMVSGAQAADLLLPAAPEVIYDDVAFSFEGFYIGIQGGAFFTDGYGGFDHTAGLVGIVAGANFLVSDAILAGLEFQGDVFFGGNDGDDSSFGAVDALILGRIGALVTDEVLVYAAGGVGIVGGTGFEVGTSDDTAGFYALGGGVEVAVTDNLGVRGEVLYKHLFNDQDASGSGVQATLGLLWHLN
jgi:outer membrane immunogenic protein